MVRKLLRKEARHRMLIWEMGVRKGAAQVGPSNVADYRIDQELDGTPHIDSWHQLSCTRPKGFRSKKLTDVVQFAPGIHYALSKRGVEALYDLIKDDAELLPIKVDDRDYWLMHVTTILDCVDYERSEFQLFPDGRIASFDAVSFKPRQIAGHNVFKTSDSPLDFLYTSNVFKERVESIDKIGPYFMLAWDSERSKPIEISLLDRLRASES